MRLYWQPSRSKSWTIFCLFLIVGQAALAQYADFTAQEATINYDSSQHFALQIQKLSSGRKIIRREGRVVRINGTDQFGFPELRRVRISRVRPGLVTFRPTNKKFPEVTYSTLTDPQGLDYLEVATGGSIVSGMAINLVTIVAVTTVVFIMAIMGHGGSAGSLKGLPLDDCLKHIRVHNKKGIQKWKLSTVPLSPTR